MVLRRGRGSCSGDWRFLFSRCAAPYFLHRLSRIVFPASSFPHRLSCTVFPASSFPHRLSCTVSPSFLSSLFRGLFPRCATPTFLLSLSLHSLSCSSPLPFLRLFSSGHLSSFPYGLPCCLAARLGGVSCAGGRPILALPMSKLEASLSRIGGHKKERTSG